MATTTVYCKRCTHTQYNTTTKVCNMCDSRDVELEWDEQGDYEREDQEMDEEDDCGLF